MAEASNPTVDPGHGIGLYRGETGFSLWQLGVAVGRYPSGSEIGVVLHTKNVSLGELTEQTNSLGLAKTNISMSSFYMSMSCDSYLSSSGTAHINPSSSKINVTAGGQPRASFIWKTEEHGQRWESHIGPYWGNWRKSNSPQGWTEQVDNWSWLEESGSGLQGSPCWGSASKPSGDQEGMVFCKYSDEFNYFGNPSNNFAIVSQSRNLIIHDFGGGS